MDVPAPSQFVRLENQSTQELPIGRGAWLLLSRLRSRDLGIEPTGQKTTWHGCACPITVCSTRKPVNTRTTDRKRRLAPLEPSPFPRSWDRTNRAEDNLAWMCLPHHSLFDSKTSQHKNYRSEEALGSS